MRVHEQFESFMGVDLFQMDHQMIMAVLRTLAKIGPRADPVFRDECEEEELVHAMYLSNGSLCMLTGVARWPVVLTVWSSHAHFWLATPISPLQDSDYV